jgi:hypothetical protein
MQQFGQQLGGAMQQAGGAMGQAFGQMGAAPAGSVKTRNAMGVLILTYGLMFGGQILGIILAFIEPMLALLGNLVVLAGAVMFLVYMIMMLMELKNYTRDDSFNWWFIFIPCLNYYLMWILTPQQVGKAKQMAQSRNSQPRSIVAYIFVPQYALAADLNDIANPAGG